MLSIVCYFPTGSWMCVIMLLEVYVMDYAEICKRVRIRRKALGITQEKLAEMVDVSTSFIGHIERGTRKLSVETLYDLCKALDVSADYLMGLEE